MDIGVWLRGLGLGQYERAFCDNDIDADVLPELTADELRELGVTSLGHRKRLLAAIIALKAGRVASAAVPPPDITADAPPSMPGEAERRQLTVMFVDLVGSTALSTRLDPEEMGGVLRAYQKAVAGEVARFEGHVAKFMGDGVLAYFGWPRAHEDEAERAVRAALATVVAVATLKASAGERLAARVGIATGLVMVGELTGEGEARERSVVGETPNLAARLQALAPPNGVVVAPVTRRLLGSLFELEELEARPIKGLAEPVAGFVILGERAGTSRFDARGGHAALPMEGRDQELALVLERWRQAAAGEGHAMLLVGEAGIGKSRLVRAVLDVLNGEEHVVIQYQCSPYHTGTALWPVARQLDFAAGLDPADTEGAKLEKLEVLLRQGADDVSEAARLVAGLLGIEAGDRYPVPDITPQQRRARTLAVLIDQLLGLTRRRPVLMVLEDAHWGDPSTLELLGLALDRIADARVLVLLTSRPDGQPSLGGHPHVTRLTLSRLGRDATRAIVVRLVSSRGLPPEVLGEIAARTDGVPLFVEELTKAVLEAGVADGGAAAVPASLHASLMARLDRVPGVKEVAQVAACVGREFDYPLLAAVSPMTELALRAALDRLVTAELVFARGEPPEASYVFKHALVRDAIHESLLRSRRQSIHGGIVRVLEERLPETVDADPELLARHCTEAGLHEKAIDYWLCAGQRAAQRSANAEAVGHFARGLEVLRSLPASPRRDEVELALQTALGMPLIATRGYAAPETGAAYARALALCEALGHADQLLPILYGRWVHHFASGKQSQGRQLAEEFLSLAEARGDRAMELVGQRILGMSLLHLGDLRQGRSRIERALGLYDPERDGPLAFSFGQDQRSSGLAFLSLVLWLSGFPNQAVQTIEQALTALAGLSHANSRGYVTWLAATLAQLRGDTVAVRKHADGLIALAEEQGLGLWLARGRLFREWSLAREEPSGLAKAVAECRATRSLLHWPYHLGLLADALRHSGRNEEGLQAVGEALALAEETGECWWEAELHRLKGELSLWLPTEDTTRAEMAYETSLRVARRQGARMLELRAAASLARLWAEQGKRLEARDLLGPIYGSFIEGFDVPDLQDAKALLNRLR